MSRFAGIFPGRRRINAAGEALIKQFEGYADTAYRCPAGHWTIGWGHTRTAIQGMVITDAQADALLREDLAAAEKGVAQLVTVPLNDNQFSALVSFAFNLGVGALGRSALLRRLNEGNYECVPDEMLRWVNAQGRFLPGLMRRRIAEGKLWVMRDT